MRNEQTSLNIGRLKSFDELMDEVLSKKGTSPISQEEEEYLRLKEIIATYEDIYNIPIKFIIEHPEVFLSDESYPKSR